MHKARLVARFMPVALLLWAVTAIGCSYTPYSQPPLAFSGDSSAAKQTVVVPTLDTPVPKGKNVIWCGTFQLCWDGLKPLVGPINVPGAEDTIRRLGASRMNPADLPKDGFYTAAGFAKDGIVGKIQSEMAAKFPEVKPSLPPMVGVEALAYAYLHDAVKFRTPYFDRERGDGFVDSAGKGTVVRTFGLSEKDPEAEVNTKLRQQIEVLYCDKKEDQLREFVLDLDKNSGPTQFILACVEPKESLAATWREVQRKMGEWKPDQFERVFSAADSLVVPDLNYKIQHSFKELEATRRLKTMQSIEFRLDKSGATLTSEAYLLCRGSMASGRSFRFTGPFLIAMRKRGSTEPYFVMWVDNAELLCKQEPH